MAVALLVLLLRAPARVAVEASRGMVWGQLVARLALASWGRMRMRLVDSRRD